ncbi:TVP38/TMEM64 family inner membrane protein YdjZ [Clostridium ragsdalei P11]|uniref:TVP38/TMEM64 family membrane protein n=1 Tax=Clostridium ragsdalei P11 TaxID=1353534 RepID=A0A1A6B2Q4_9CLOT|nr:VTT domain-containing protein [Clostridium ragsdalei]OBR96563.1 TVP38/TMEM64 family inner membrane protein YdjZ [Clostridium ragsdalei P11]
MNKNRKLLIYKILLVLLGIFTITLVMKYLPRIIELTVSLDKFRGYIVSLGRSGSIVFIFFQILQTVIAPIPGEVIQVAGGYIYDVPLGIIYTTVGMLLGAIIAFYFTRLIGGSFIQKLLKGENSQWMKNIMDSKKFSFILFIVFLVPGLPKDFLIYVAGLTSIKPLRFFGILLVSRFPWLLASVSIGSNLHYGNYVSTMVVSFIALISFVLGIVYKDKLINKLSYDKNVQESYKAKAN